MIRHIVFDFGGVILDLDGVHTGYPDDLAVIFSIPIKEAKKIWDENKTSVITGKETPKEFLARMKAELGLSFGVEEGIRFWETRNGITRERIDWKLVAMLEALKQKYQVHMLTDQIQLGNGAQDWIHEVRQHFHTIFTSYEQGFRKPFPEAYTNMLQKIDAEKDPETVVFIDDNAQNIEASQKLGIHSLMYRFGNRDELKTQLRELGVEIEA